MANNIELLSNTENFTIGTNSNLSEILANVVRVGTDTSNVTISIPQDISSSYNLILPVRQGASGESLVYGADGQLKWDVPTVLKQVVSVYGPNLTSNVVSTGIHDSPTYLDAYTANITPKAENSKFFVQFKVNYHAALSASNQITFFIKKSYDGNETIFTESLFGPYNAAGGFTGQYISNLVDEALTSNSISYQLGYQINGTVDLSDTLGILGYDASYNNTIVLQEFEGSGVYATSVWNKGSDSNGLYYNEGTVHIGSSKNALGSQNTPGVALELSGNLVGTNATFSGNITAYAITVEEAYIGPNTLYINGTRVLNQNDNGSVNVYTDQIISDASNGLTIQANGDNGNIILDPSGTGSIQLNGDVELSGGNISAETFIGDLSGNVNAITMTATTTTTNNLSLDGTLTTSNSTRVEGNLIPSANITYDLGSSTHMWRDVYVGPGSLYVNNKKVIEDNSDTINISTDEGQNLKIKTSGAGGQLQIQSAEGGISMSKTGNTGDITITTTSGGDINMNSHDNVQITAGDDLQLTSTTGTIQLKSAVNITHGMTVSNPTGDDIKIDDNLQITGQVKTNEIIEYTINSGVTIENVLIKDGNVSGNLVGNVTGTVSSLSNHTTDNLSEGSTNKYYSNSLVDSHLEGGTGVSYSNGSISIGQPVGTSANVQFNNVTVDGTLNSDDITGSNVTVSNDLVVSGNLTVNGTRTIVKATTLDIGDNKIVVNAGGSTTDAGIIANVSGTEHEFVYSTNNNAWGTTGNLNIGGNVTATQFNGDGSQLTGITDTTYTAGTGLSLNGTMFNNTAPDQTVTITGNGATTVTGTYPNFTITSTDTNTDTNTTYSAGTGVSINGSNQISIGQSVGTSANVQFNNVTVDGTLHSDDITGSNVTVSNDLVVSGNLTVNGNLVGNVIGIVSSLSNHTTDELSEGSTNKYFSTSLVDSHLEGGTGISYSNGSISIGQSVGTSANVQFNNVTVDGTLHSDDITGSNVTVSNDLVVSGNLTVNGTRTIVKATTLDIGDNKIVVNAGGSTTDAGIIANVSGTEHEFVYSTNNNAWGTTGDLNIGGNVIGTTFIGDGSQLTGITDTTYTAGTGLSLDGTMFNNTAPDQTVTITGSGATTVTGTYPNFTITSTDTNTDTNTTYSAGTGMGLVGTTFNIGQPVGTSDSPTFNQLNVVGNIKGDNLILGEYGQTPKIDMLYAQGSNPSVGYDKRITIGVVDDFPNTTGFPAFPPTGSMGINIQNNSDAFFIGIEEHATGNYRPLLKWGDDGDDTPFTIQSYNGNNKWEFGLDGILVVPNVVKGASGTVCKIHILPFTDAETANVSSGAFTDVLGKTFTKTAGTNLFGEVHINYTISGFGGDAFQARLNFFNNPGITGGEYDILNDSNVGGGGRSGDINGAAVYTNGTGTANSGSQGIYLQAMRNGGDDTITFKAGFFKVTEIWA